MRGILARPAQALFTAGMALLLLPLSLTSPAQAQSQASDAAFERTAAMQGEYEGWVSGGFRRTRVGVQLVASGLDEYHAVVFPGGLPGHGADAEQAERAIARTLSGLVLFNTPSYRVLATAQAVRLYSPEGVLRGVLAKVHRSSPTIGAPPPAGAVVLFDGSAPAELADARVTEDGLLQEGAITRRPVRDFFLHAEFRIPFMPEANSQARGNSGLYLQRRYEVQILDSFGLEGTSNECGSLYRQRRPAVNACLPPQTWQTYDIEFRAARYNAAGEKTDNARITVRLNGIVVHDDVELTAKTGAGQPEGPNPLPILFQDHGDPVRFRNVWMIPRGE